MAMLKTKRVWVWCQQPSLYHSEDRYGENKQAKKVRCPTCGKKLRLKTENGEPNGPAGSFKPMFYYPPHKRPVKQP